MSQLKKFMYSKLNGLELVGYISVSLFMYLYIFLSLSVLVYLFSYNELVAYLLAYSSAYLVDYILTLKFVFKETHFWTKPLKHESLEVYAAAIDTTFAVYNKRNDNYCGGKGKENSVRVAGNFTAIHYPWIEKDPMPKSEEDFYLENGNLKIINWHNKN